MAYTQSDIDALQAAIATGATLVKFGSGADSREVRYRDLASMREILAQMQAEVSGTQQSLRTVGGYASGLSEGPFYHDFWWRR